MSESPSPSANSRLRVPDLPGLDVLLRPLTALKTHPRHARRHTAIQIDKIAGCIAAYGFTAPVIIGTGDVILAGDARVKAARKAGLVEVPTVSLAHLNPDDQRGYMLADNKLAELSRWDDEILKLEILDLAGLELELSLTGLGFETAELDLMLDDHPDLNGAPDPADDAPEVETVAVSRPGDVWNMNEHRLVCGDARDPAAYAALMPDGEQARMVFADSPWNLPIVGFVSGRDSDRREFPMGTGEMTPAEFTAFLTQTLGLAAEHAMDGAIVFACIDWRHLPELTTAGLAAVGELKNICVWVKPNAGLGACYRSQMELVMVLKKAGATYVNNFGLGKVRYRTNVWQYPGASGFHADRAHDLELHPTAKPVALVADAIMDVSHRDEIVLDPFGGSGATLMAAERTGRRARLIELDPLYCDVICRRFIAGGGEARLEATGASFSDVATERHTTPEQET